MTAPLFTVLINTFNYGKYVEEAVRSVLEQDFPAQQVEILVVDDGSTDDTEQRLEKFGGAIRYLKKPNGGQASAFNFGWPHARGEFIALLDADDVWLPNKLRRVDEAFLSQPDAGWKNISRSTAFMARIYCIAKTPSPAEANCKIAW